MKISFDDWVVTYPFVIPDKKMNKDYSTVFLFIGYNLINVGSEYKYFYLNKTVTVSSNGKLLMQIRIPE